MIITGKTIEEKYLDSNSNYCKVNQVGIDLSVSKIEKIKGKVLVLKNKTIVKKEAFEEISPESFYVPDEDNWVYGWDLEEGAYALTFNEGIKIPADKTGFIQSRSSIYRGGSLISSPVWDPGFETKIMGTTMITEVPIFIEQNARVGQFFMHENHTPDELYNGQFQNKTNYE